MAEGSVQSNLKKDSDTPALEEKLNIYNACIVIFIYMFRWLNNRPAEIVQFKFVKARTR